ncbi:MAG TPA: hypothetical protein VMZ03_06305 [Chitinophagaceae bacterium]|nr:hypothetical protein [Chitinophagaceae bacterium]
MPQLFSIIVRLLSDKKMSAFIILLAIGARVIQLLFYLDSFFDTSFQVIATQNFVAGHGISTAVVNPTDLSATIYQPLVNWPPGYSLLLTPFYIASGHNYLIACFTLDILAAIAIILLCRKILKQLDVYLPVINLFTLFTSFFIYYFYYTGSTDSISIAFFLAAIYFTLTAIQSNQKWTSRALVTGTCLLLSAGLKYLFFPVVFTLPVFLFIYGVQHSSAGAKKAAWLSFSIIAVGIAALFLYQKSISGTGAHISSPGRGFFPEHLLRAYPFIPCSFITPNTLRKLPGDTGASVLNTFRVLHLLVYLSILVIALTIFIRKGLKNASLSKVFLFLALSISLAITLVLVFLSLVVDKELMPPDRWWTYVEDARYYGLAEILVHISIFLFLSRHKNLATRALRTIALILPFLLLPEIFRGVAFTAKRLINMGREKYYWQQERGFQNFALKAVKKKQDSLHIHNAVVSGSLYYANNRASLHQQIPVLEDVYSLNDPKALKTTKPIVLLGIIRGDRRDRFGKFINYSQTELAGEYNGFYFYTLYVVPE